MANGNDIPRTVEIDNLRVGPKTVIGIVLAVVTVGGSFTGLAMQVSATRTALEVASARIVKQETENAAAHRAILDLIKEVDARSRDNDKLVAAINARLVLQGGGR
jgi:hypothetical protein